MHIPFHTETLAMPDALHASLNWVDHNRYLAIAIGATILLMVTLVGCEPRTTSPFDGQRVTQRQLVAQTQAYEAQLQTQVSKAERDYQQTLDELQAQAVAGQAKAEAALEEIAQRKAALTMAMESITQLASAAAGPQFVPLIGSAAGIAGVLLGLGATADSKRKDQVILNIKSQPPDAAAAVA